MKFKFILIFIACFIVLHFVLYFFNIDPFEMYEKKPNTVIENEHIDTSIQELTDSLEQLKEINQ